MPLLIPRVFHHIWLGPKPLPDNFRQWAQRWLDLNPGWTMEHWRDDRLPDITNSAEFDGAESMAARSDVLRYELLASRGGVYVDADMEPLNAIEPILDGVEAFVGDERPATPCNAILGSVVDHSFFRAVVERLPASSRGPGDIVDKTGPRFMNRVIEEFFGPKRSIVWDDPLPRRCRITGAAGAPGAGRFLHEFDWRVFYPYYYTEPMREWDVFPDAISRHHWAASWWKNAGI